MSIWVHDNDAQRKPTLGEYKASLCVFCQTALANLGSRFSDDDRYIQGGSATITVYTCLYVGGGRPLESSPASTGARTS